MTQSEVCVSVCVCVCVCDQHLQSVIIFLLHFGQKDRGNSKSSHLASHPILSSCFPTLSAFESGKNESKVNSVIHFAVSVAKILQMIKLSKAVSLLFNHSRFITFHAEE